MNDCIFCQIAAGEIPCFKIYEEEDFLAFLDINPRKHYRWVWDMPEELVGQYFAVVNKVANHYRQVFKTEFVMSWIYGFEVPHAHIHLFPNSRGKIAFYPKEKLPTLTNEEGEKLAAALKLK